MKNYIKHLVPSILLGCLYYFIFNGDVLRLAKRLGDIWDSLMAPLPKPLTIVFTVGLYVASIFGLLCLGHWLDVQKEKKDNKDIP